MYYSISETAEKCGISAHTLRYYDKEGSLPFVERTKAGIRKFKTKDLEWISLIICLKNSGLKIKQIKEFIDWCQQGDETLNLRYNFFKQQKENILAQIEGFNHYLQTIERKLNYYKEAMQSGTEGIPKEKALNFKKTSKDS